jgi:hypothetical protein
MWRIVVFLLQKGKPIPPPAEWRDFQSARRRSRLAGVTHKWLCQEKTSVKIGIVEC